MQEKINPPPHHRKLKTSCRHRRWQEDSPPPEGQGIAASRLIECRVRDGNPQTIGQQNGRSIGGRSGGKERSISLDSERNLALVDCEASRDSRIHVVSERCSSTGETPVIRLECPSGSHSTRTRLRIGGYSHGLGRLVGSINDGEGLPGGKSQLVAIDADGDSEASVALMDVDPRVTGDDGIRCRVGATPWAGESEGLDPEAGEGVGGGESGRGWG